MRIRRVLNPLLSSGKLELFLAFCVIGLTATTAMASSNQHPGTIPLEKMAPGIKYFFENLFKKLGSSSQDCGTAPLEELTAAIKDYDDNLFKRERSRKQLEKQIGRALRHTRRGRYGQAVWVLTKRVLPKVDGCMESYTPDHNDTIVECKTQGYIHDQVEASIRKMCSCSPEKVERLLIKSGDLAWCYEPEPPGVDNDDVPPLESMHLDNTLDVTFFVIGDPHFNSDYKYDGAHVCWGFKDDNEGDNQYRKFSRQYAVPNDINQVCYLNDWNGRCIGGVMVGDMIREYKGGQWDDSVAAFRAFWEFDNPKGVDKDCCTNCDYCKTPGGWAQINYPLFLLLGNHDDPTEWDQYDVQDYVRDRVIGSALYNAMPGEYYDNYYKGNGSDLYAWEWGSFHFISLGIWAFYDKYHGGSSESRDSADPGKIEWLKNHLKSIGKEKPIILFQHFGFDHWTLTDENDNGWPKWWSAWNQAHLGDVICDTEFDTGGCEEPYNVIGIFTGHNHAFDYIDKSCIDGIIKDGKWDTCTGEYPFHNFVVDDAGFEDDGGYFLVRLQIESDNAGKMTVDQVKLNFYDSHHWVNDCCAYRENDRVYNGPGTGYPKTVSFNKSEYLRFQQGEPNNVDGVEHCAEVRYNGRYNDARCDEKTHVLCYDSDDHVWNTSIYTYTWREAFPACRRMEGGSYEFTEPKNISQQKAVIELLRDKGIGGAWVNYMNKRTGQWEEASWHFEYFDDMEPDNGWDRYKDWAWGENCALLKKKDDGTIIIEDARCETGYHSFVCRDRENELHVEETKGYWGQGYKICSENGADFKFPLSHTEFKSMLDQISSFWNDNPGEALWLGFNDMDKEGDWTREKPWFFGTKDSGEWHPGEPNGGTVENCIEMTADGWNDTRCSGASNDTFACRHRYTGDWITTAGGSTIWASGFDYCQQLGTHDWIFDYPYRKKDYDKILELREQQSWNIWINLTDAREEAHYRFGYWLSAASLIHEWSGHCVALDNTYGAITQPCDTVYPYSLCERVEDGFLSVISSNVSWQDAKHSCPDGFIFSYLGNSIEWGHLEFFGWDPWMGRTWMNLSDLKRKGFWEYTPN